VARSIFKITSFQLKSATPFFALVLALIGAAAVLAQSGDHTLFGDLTVDESKVAGLKPLSFDVFLYSDSGVLVSRQPVANNGRYRFNNLAIGGYQLVIEVEATEVARLNVDLRSPLLRDVRRDVSLEWRLPNKRSRAGLISAADNYVRSASNQKLFKQALAANAKKRYAKAAELLQQITRSDAKDFQAWTELANIHFLQKNFADAENEYLHALDANHGFFLALLNLGRLESFQKRYDVAIDALTKAVKAQPDSPDANYFLGDAYLQNRKGSAAVEYFREALRLDPVGMAEVHLRLALLYHAAGARDKAAAEYEEFLKKRPDYSERQKLRKYIAANKKL
jgi:tetratricopeptide (TPR) repeat protein